MMRYAMFLFFMDTHLGALCVGLLGWFVLGLIALGVMSIGLWSVALGGAVLSCWGLGKLIQIGCDR